MSDAATLVERRDEMKEKHAELSEIFDLARDGSAFDFSRRAVLEKTGAKDHADALAKVQTKSKALEALGAEIAQLNAREMDRKNRELAGSFEEPAAYVPGQPFDGAGRSFGERFVKHKVFAEAWLKHRTIGVPATIDIGIKTLMTRTAGFAPESTRTGQIVDYMIRPIQVLDLFPTRPLAQAVDKYMEETTRTHSAAEKAEAAAYAESAFAWTERTETVQKITDSVPVTDEQLEDAPEVAGVLNQRLTFGLRQRLETQCILGDGTAPNLSGILDRAIQTQAKGADPIFTAVFKALTLVRHTGFADPNAIIFNPTDWLDVRTATTTAGEYIMGPPSAPGVQTLFGLPVALAGALTENTALVGDFANFCYIGERRGIDIQIGYSGTQFAEGKKLVRADLRACFSVTRPYAFCSITGV